MDIVATVQTKSLGMAKTLNSVCYCRDIIPRLLKPNLQPTALTLLHARLRRVRSCTHLRGIISSLGWCFAEDGVLRGTQQAQRVVARVMALVSELFQTFPISRSEEKRKTLDRPVPELKSGCGPELRKTLENFQSFSPREGRPSASVD